MQTIPMLIAAVGEIASLLNSRCVEIAHKKTLVLLIEVHDGLSITPGERDEIHIHQAEKKVAESRRALLPGGRMIAIVLRKIRAGTAPQAVRFSDGRRDRSGSNRCSLANDNGRSRARIVAVPAIRCDCSYCRAFFYGQRALPNQR
jgi:hypothetical protein